MMTPMIPQDIIEQIRNANNIVDVIGEYVRLKKRGRNYLALCPFHNEKTPSFSVSPDKQIFHCFGCGKGGNVFTFLMEHENLTFIEAVRHLARRAGITIPEKKIDQSAKEELEKLYYAQQLALDYFQETLYSNKYKTQILEYLKNNRRLSETTIEYFGLGLAGEEWDGFLNYALKKGLFPNELVSAGLVIHSQKRDKYFDRFRQRLMIPIFNLSGKPIAFGGRTLKRGERAKYINSPETKLYSKSNVLYGLNFTRQAIRESNEVIIVEGYFDLISLFQAGIKNVVASSGTAFTSSQARLLARFADTAFLFFDADSAGQRAAVRSVDALYDAGLEVLVMMPPPDEDPDSVATRDGAAGISEIKAKALRYLEYRTRDIDPESQGIIGKERLIKELAEVAGRIDDFTRRQLFVGDAAAIINVDPNVFYRLLPRMTPAGDRSAAVTPPKGIADMERDLLSLVINFPEHIKTVEQQIAPDDFHTPEHARLYGLLLTGYKTGGARTPGSMIDMIEEPALAALVSSLAETDWHHPAVDKLVEDYIDKLLYFKRERIIDQLKAELREAEEKSDSEAARRLTVEIADLIRKRRK